ncbi:MAG: methylenetetrahydrofolate--tRNA-(uracil(54)-C(5))-methyltransferase (FADH(2)-oxidizing) TrmFO [Syntrophomonadaceae bacterium]|jgi:methylenetetrahydrofolate--tRNA-(uracil-5-)-methyltransferase|nr:methylenetetrahydrofolate--tRNA-(uracil(54)-C(5))-methyltransferase (FADH(2)-oxidizing) TrmFO [Syntrophomonadaceae bacterium]
MGKTKRLLSAARTVNVHIRKSVSQTSGEREMKKSIHVVGGGLAGCEAAHFIARAGVKVHLWEMRPKQTTPVHYGGDLAELVCSNSLKSELKDTAQGLLKMEMDSLGSLVLKCARLTRVPASAALAVDRKRFSALMTQTIIADPNIEIIRQEITELPTDEICIIATGPLTSEAFSQYLQKMTGQNNLFFYDAIAPSVTSQSIDYQKVFRASRYKKGEADYLNCPFSQTEYENFYYNLMDADVKTAAAIDEDRFFNACMPIEVMAEKGIDTLRFGPMRPVGLFPPGTDARPYAVVQLRQEDREGNIFGLVGFQSRIRWKEQERVFRMIPGLENAEFVRFGSMHRNTYINSPLILNPTLQSKNNENIFWAGQITGVEGYMESAASGIFAGINALRFYKGLDLLILPLETMMGSLLNFIGTAKEKNFQPINANFGILPPLENHVKDKKRRYAMYIVRAWELMTKFSELL